MLRPTDPEGMRAAWVALEDEWSKTISMAKTLPEEALHQSVNDEWSFVQTLRHLVFAMDKWFTVPVLGEGFHPTGLPNTGSVDYPFPGLDYGQSPVRLGSARRSRGSCDAPSRLSRNGRGDRLRPPDRRARERHEPVARVPLHRLRGGVLAPPLRPPRPCRVGSAERGAELRDGSGVAARQGCPEEIGELRASHRARRTSPTESRSPRRRRT